MQKTVPFTKSQIEEIIKEYPTPFHIYDERAIRENARRLLKSFSGFPGFHEFFAVKACPNPYILEILMEEGFGADCSSDTELELARRVGIIGENIMFSSNDTQKGEFEMASHLEAIINLDDVDMIPFLEEEAGMPNIACFRYNPGPRLKTNTSFIGKPEEAKYGLTREQLTDAYKYMRDRGVRRFGLHTMVASNELDPAFFIENAEMLFDIVVELSHELEISFEFINIGGGIGIPYQPGQDPVDLDLIARGIKAAYIKKISANDLNPLKLYMENGRMVTGPYGYLVAKAIHKKSIYRDYVGLDACMANLMRPALYGAYHHITVMGKEHNIKKHIYDVTGSLCENNDKFAVQRLLPEVSIGDTIVIHDAGAHGHAMGFNYNGKKKSAELLLREDGSVQQIRRAETLEDLFATLDFSMLKHAA